MTTSAQNYLRALWDEKIAQAEDIIKTAEREGRSVNRTEARQVKQVLAEADEHLGKIENMKSAAELRAKVRAETSSFNASVALPAGKAQSPFANAVLSAGLHLKEQPSVELSAAAAFGVKAPTLPGGETWDITTAGVQDLAADRRWIFRNIPSRDAEDATAVSDFRVTNRTLTGTVQRDIDATTGKATLDHTLTAVTLEMQQHAVVIPDVPNALLDAVDSLRAILDNEARTAVFTSIDNHVYTAISAAANNGTTGTGLPAQVRNAVASMRAAGQEPDLLVLDPADAVTLDLFEDTGGNLVFSTRDTGSSSPLWGLRVVESVAAVGADPLLVDTDRTGVLYLGRLKIDLDPYSGFRNNLTDIRAETSALMVVRDASAAFRIGV
jgi:hypothetical protein